MWQFLSFVSLVFFGQIQLDLSQPICKDGSQPTCPGGTRLTSGNPPCRGGNPVCADGQEVALQSEGGMPQLGGGNLAGGAPLSSSPHAAAMLGKIAFTTATGTNIRTSTNFFVGETIHGPFVEGFGSQQDDILASLGCSPPSLGYVQGGIDTQTAEQIIASKCGTTLPRIQGNAYISLMDECGGHTNKYHFHERMGCLYNGSAHGHSTQIGRLPNGQFIYGKWEETRRLPLLDACGGHLGRTPESPSVDLYHYHVQDSPPFTVGCLGPNDDGSLVTVQQCRDFYSGCDGDFVNITTPARGRYEYDRWCPCFDALGLNTGVRIAELPVNGGTLPPTPILTPAPTPYPAVPHESMPGPTNAPTISDIGRMPAPVPTSSSTSSNAADTMNYKGQYHLTVMILLVWWWLFFEQR